ncbi:MAG TPA: zinc ribbon domain-containing protein [Gaiellaceae bacterium]|nr:zinc ribbon domain-containing protein [Gaiellaceae bacterium]
MSDPVLHCPRCEAVVQPGQEYCLECGGRLGHARPGPVERAAAGVSERHAWAGAWVLPTLIGLVIAILGTGAAIAISDDGDRQAAISTATGGSPTVTDTGSTLTAPEPTETTPTTTAPAPTTTAPPPPPNPAAVSWPRDRRGWTIVLLALPQANGRSAAAATAAKARTSGLRQVGVLDSSRYASLRPGYYVVFTGVYDTEPEAASALQRARAVFPTAYQREIVP